MSPEDIQMNDLPSLQPLFFLMLCYVLTFHITIVRQTTWSYYKLYKILHHTLWNYTNKSKVTSLKDFLCSKYTLSEGIVLGKTEGFGQQETRLVGNWFPLLFILLQDILDFIPFHA